MRLAPRTPIFTFLVVGLGTIDRRDNFPIDEIDIDTIA